MKIYSIFDDFDKDAIRTIEDAGGYLTVHSSGVPRPDAAKMKAILEEYDCVIIGTSQKITEDMFGIISTPKVIATASVGIDHINVPKEKKELITILNTPKANAQSVAEYTIGCVLACCKRLIEGTELYKNGKNNKQLYQKPEDLAGKIIGIVGAGNISAKIMEYAQIFGMKILCWTRNPDHHRNLKEKGIRFVSLEMLAKTSDVISVNIPNKTETRDLISAELVRSMKDTAIFISVSRLEIVNINALLDKAYMTPGFYVCLDLDLNEEVIEKLKPRSNVIITPHIAGGTVETRKRMFREIANQIAEIIQENV